MVCIPIAKNYQLKNKPMLAKYGWNYIETALFSLKVYNNVSRYVLTSYNSLDIINLSNILVNRLPVKSVLNKLKNQKALRK